MNSKEINGAEITIINKETGGVIFQGESLPITYVEMHKDKGDKNKQANI